jgi:hypothetical protein
VTLGEVCWIPLLPPDELGLYVIRFYAALDSALASKPAAC